MITAPWSASDFISVEEEKAESTRTERN